MLMVWYQYVVNVNNCKLVTGWLCYSVQIFDDDTALLQDLFGAKHSVPSSVLYYNPWLLLLLSLSALNGATFITRVSGIYVVIRCTFRTAKIWRRIVYGAHFVVKDDVAVQRWLRGSRVLSEYRIWLLWWENTTSTFKDLYWKPSSHVCIDCASFWIEVCAVRRHLKSVCLLCNEATVQAFAYRCIGLC